MTVKKVLFCTEASYTSSGIATNCRELLNRFYASGKYELAEFAAYGADEFMGETRYHSLPWKYYPNCVTNEEEAKIYNHERDRYGAWKFDSVVEQFKPDIILSVSDPWMFEYQAYSQLRNTYRWFIMPPIDSEHSNPKYTRLYENADGVFVPTNWAYNILKRNGNINLLGVVHPGFHQAYQPVPDKSSHKQICGFKPDDIIFGSVMRNQFRKLYPNIAMTFGKLKDNLEPDLWNRCKLYWHCQYPDLAWNIPRLIIENDIGKKVYMTYACGCGAIFPSLFNGIKRPCPECNKTAIFPGSGNGIPEEGMAQIYNLFDCCIQYSKMEGTGYSQIEAGACGVPVITVDHSGMKDFVELGARTVPLLTELIEPDSHRRTAVPDDNILLKHMIEFAKNPTPDWDYTKKVRERHNWDIVADKWMEIFDSA